MHMSYVYWNSEVIAHANFASGLSPNLNSDVFSVISKCVHFYKYSELIMLGNFALLKIWTYVLVMYIRYY